MDQNPPSIGIFFRRNKTMMGSTVGELIEKLESCAIYDQIEVVVDGAPRITDDKDEYFIKTVEKYATGPRCRIVIGLRTE